MTMRQAGGEGNALFESLYGRYYTRMLRYFRQVFRVSDADAQELTQDSFVRFFRAMDEYRGQAEWALLETIARNVGYNRIRSVSTIKRGSVRPESLDDRESPKDAPDPTQVHPMDRMIETERLRRLRQAITELPGGQRQCLQLWLEDLSSEEISRALRISVVAVKSRIRDAKRTLRERLGDEGALPEEWNHDEQI
jgi:RNA polymerase sigma-70 factor (ECF subfamily)